MTQSAMSRSDARFFPCNLAVTENFPNSKSLKYALSPELLVQKPLYVVK
jgi:hypothetical protein